MSKGSLPEALAQPGEAMPHNPAESLGVPAGIGDPEWLGEARLRVMRADLPSSDFRREGADAVVVDIDAGALGSAEALSACVAAAWPKPAVGIAAAPSRDRVREAFAAGFAAVARKSMTPQALTAVIRLVATGERYAPAELLLDEISADMPPGGADRRSPGALSFPGAASLRFNPTMLAPADGLVPVDTAMVERLGLLSHRERMVVAELACGSTNKEIARRLEIREITVKSHLKSVFKKLGIRNRIMAAKIALEHGLTMQ